MWPVVLLCLWVEAEAALSGRDHILEVGQSQTQRFGRIFVFWFCSLFCLGVIGLNLGERMRVKPRLAGECGNVLESTRDEPPTFARYFQTPAMLSTNYSRSNTPLPGPPLIQCAVLGTLNLQTTAVQRYG